MDITGRVAVNIRMIARGRGIGMQALADHLEMSKQVFYKRLKGDSEWKIAELASLAAYLGTTVETLLADPSDLLTRISGWSYVIADGTLHHDELLVSDALVQAA